VMLFDSAVVSVLFLLWWVLDDQGGGKQHISVSFFADALCHTF